MLFPRFMLVSMLFMALAIVQVTDAATPPKPAKKTVKSAKPGEKVTAAAATAKKEDTEPETEGKIKHTETSKCNTGKLDGKGFPIFKDCEPGEKGKHAVAKDAPKPDTPEAPAGGEVKIAK